MNLLAAWLSALGLRVLRRALTERAVHNLCKSHVLFKPMFEYQLRRISTALPVRCSRVRVVRYF